MTEQRNISPRMAEAVRRLGDADDRHTNLMIDAALQPLIARIEDMERQVAELRGDPAPDPGQGEAATTREVADVTLLNDADEVPEE